MYFTREILQTMLEDSNARGQGCTWQTADNDNVSTYQISSVQLVTDKKLEAFDKAKLRPSHLWDVYYCSGCSVSTLRSHITRE